MSLSVFDSDRIVFVGKMQQHHIPGGSFDEGADRRLAGFADNQVTFPMTGHSPVGNFGRPVGNHQHLVAEPWAFAFYLRPTSRAPAAEGLLDIFFQMPFALDEQ